MEDAWLCWEADADGLGRRMFGFCGRSCGLDTTGGSGQPWWVQAVDDDLGAALLCSKPLSQSHPELCRGLTAVRASPHPGFCHLWVSVGEDGDVKHSSPFSSGDDDSCTEGLVFSGKIYLSPRRIIPLWTHAGCSQVKEGISLLSPHSP